VPCAVSRARDASVDVVEIVCMAALEAVRGHGGQTAQWLGAATSTIAEALDELARERAEEPGWRWLVRRVPRW